MSFKQLLHEVIILLVSCVTHLVRCVMGKKKNDKEDKHDDKEC